jgi:hypothetical protein
VRKIRVLVVSFVIAALALFPLASPASATHSCATEPGTLEDHLCEDVPHTIGDKLNSLFCKLLPIC